MVQPAPDHLSHPLRDRNAPARDFLWLLEPPVRHQQAHDLVHEERVPLGLTVHGLDKLIGRRHTCGYLYEPPHVLFVKATQQNSLAQTLAR